MVHIIHVKFLQTEFCLYLTICTYIVIILCIHIYTHINLFDVRIITHKYQNTKNGFFPVGHVLFVCVCVRETKTIYAHGETRWLRTRRWHPRVQLIIFQDRPGFGNLFRRRTGSSGINSRRSHRFISSLHNIYMPSEII